MFDLSSKTGGRRLYNSVCVLRPAARVASPDRLDPFHLALSCLGFRPYLSEQQGLLFPMPCDHLCDPLGTPSVGSGERSGLSSRAWSNNGSRSFRLTAFYSGREPNRTRSIILYVKTSSLRTPRGRRQATKRDGTDEPRHSPCIPATTRHTIARTPPPWP